MTSPLLTLRRWLQALLPLAAFPLLAQQPAPALPDTLAANTLAGVEIWGFPEGEYAVGALQSAYDSSLRRLYGGDHLGTFLQQHSGLYIKSYGSSRIATATFRGTGAEHTRLLWNGLPINSPSLGLSDLALLPAMAFDDVRVHHGNGGALFGSGAIGGTISLNSQPLGRKAPRLDFRQGWGSYDWRSTQLRLRYGTGPHEGSSFFYYTESDQRIPIRQPGQPLRWQQNARGRQLGFLQDWYWSAGRWNADVHAWFFSADRQLPPPVTRATDDDRQWDRGWRLAARLQREAAKGTLTLLSGWSREVQRFNDYQAVDATTRTDQWVGSAQQEWRLGSAAAASAGLQLTASHAAGASLAPVWEWRPSAFARVRGQWRGWRASAQLRREWTQDLRGPWVPSAGLERSVWEGSRGRLLARGQWSGGYRMPTLNHRYWNPGGNPSLLPERSQAREGGLAWEGRRMQVQAQYFWMDISDWILWRPQGSFWSPENVRRVRSEGLETSASAHWGTGKAGGQYTYTHARIRQDQLAAREGSPLFYVPAHKAGAWAQQVLGKGWEMLASAQYTGARHDIGSAVLQPFWTADVAITWRMPQPEWKGVIWQLRLDNLFDTAYENVANYPMPGRTWRLIFRWTDAP